MTDESASPPRRWLVPVLVVTGVVLLVAAGSVVTLARYAPLGVGPGATLITAPTGEASRVPYGGTRLAVVQYVDQATMTYTFDLANDGPVGVTVTDIEVREGPGRLLRLDGYQPDSNADSRGARDERPSFALGGGASRRVTLFFTFVNCQQISPRTGTNVDAVRVHYRGFGLVPRSMDVRLPDLIRTQSPSMHSRCPGVTMDSRPPG